MTSSAFSSGWRGCTCGTHIALVPFADSVSRSQEDVQAGVPCPFAGLAVEPGAAGTDASDRPGMQAWSAPLERITGSGRARTVPGRRNEPIPTLGRRS